MQYISKYASPLGNILLAADTIGLTGLWFEGQKYFARCLDKEHKETALPIFDEAKKWLDVYFSGEEPKFTPEENISVNTMKIQSVEGDDLVSGIRLEPDVQAEEIKAEAGQQANDFCPAEGVFIAMGTAGSTEIARQMGAELTEKGNIKVNENMETTIPGLYAAGDCTGGLLQVAKAVYEGAQAGINAGKYVRSLK